MKTGIPLILWAIVLIVAVTTFLSRDFSDTEIVSGSSSNIANQTDPELPPDAVIVKVPWRHLPDIDPFKLTDQNGDVFDSGKLAGKPYAVCFFFARCPSICRDLTKRIETLNQQLKKTDIQFISISVEPEHDTPEVLNRYAADFGATPDRWAFLTGQPYQVEQIGIQNFQVVIDPANHIDNILLVDKWGRYRDRFKWDDPIDTRRFLKVAKALAAEEQVPINKSINTRNALAGHRPPDWSIIPFIREFWLQQSNGSTFYSRDMTGSVWIANFFFTSCPTVCVQQAEHLQGLQERLGDRATRIISITTDPVRDRPEVLQSFAQKHSADPQRWTFCTGESVLIPRVGAEFFGAAAKPNDGTPSGHHSSELFVVDRWGKVRGRFDWQDAAAEVEMLDLIDRLWEEKTPGDYLSKE